MPETNGSAPAEKPRSLGEGDIVFELAGQQVAMKPTLSALINLSKKYDGLQALITRLGRLEFDVVVDVLASGLNRGQSLKDRAALAQQAYETGLSDQTGRLAEHCIDYIMVLMSGGRKPPPPKKPGEEEANDLEADAQWGTVGNAVEPRSSH